MRAEFMGKKRRNYRSRRTTGDRVREALLMLGEAQGCLLNHGETPWASITFAGSRHELMLDFAGPEAVAAGERFIAALPDHEFAIPGQLVADATISSVNHMMHPAPRMIVTATLLLLEDA
ncbi:hypothetical protein [Altererythrobacter sp. Z27]|uniref:hypothetical protein n=1 Tax=Altererythrobacter sp. Z27 TaxID=3461147 RepID=UPI0040446848